MKLPRQEIKTIVIFRALQLGDLLCSIPAIRALRNAYPDAEISLMGLPGMRELVERFPNYIDHFISFPGYLGLPEQGYDPETFKQFAVEMRTRNFDLILQMQGNGNIVNQMLQLFGSRFIAGFCEKQCHGDTLMFPYPNHGHEVTRHLALMNHLGIDINGGTSLEFPLKAADFDFLNAHPKKIVEKKYICLHPGSRGTWRQWPPVYFAAIGDVCIENGFEVVITGTPDELALATHIGKLMQHQPVICAGKTSMGEVAALLKHSQGLIANCTGVSHVAAALKVPSVVISMDGEPHRWGPLNRALHCTIDWTQEADYHAVEQAVLSKLLVAAG